MDIINMISGPLSYRVFRETGPWPLNRSLFRLIIESLQDNLDERVFGGFYH